MYCQVVVLWVHTPEQPLQWGVSHMLNTVRLIVCCCFCPVGLQIESYVHNGGRVLLAGGVLLQRCPACSLCVLCGSQSRLRAGSARQAPDSFAQVAAIHITLADH